MYRLRSGSSYTKPSACSPSTATRSVNGTTDSLQTTIQFRKRRRAVNPSNKKQDPPSVEEREDLVEKCSPPKRTKQQQPAMPQTRSSTRKMVVTCNIRRLTKSQSSHTTDVTPSPPTPSTLTPTTPTFKRRSPLKENNTPVKSPSTLGSCDPSPKATPSHMKSIKEAHFTTPKSTNRRLVFPESSTLCEVKKSLHNSLPSSLLCREDQLSFLAEFIQTHLQEEQSGSLYISGAPGTGKTACLSNVLEKSHVLVDSVHIVTVNCMSIKQPQAIYSRIACELLGSKVAKTKSMAALQNALVKYITTCKDMVLIVLDEVDQLDCRGQEILYTIFEWPALLKSKLLLIGIANALDLTDRVLPRLQSHSKCKPQLLHFPPYTKDQIATILQDRLSCGGPSMGGDVVDPMAVQFCARKVAAVHGDVRKALDICRRAIEMVQTRERSQSGEQSDKENKATPPKKTVRVTLRHIADVISEVYSSNIGTQKGQLTFPLQQKLAACTLLCMVKGRQRKESTLGKLYDAYVKVCRHRRLRYEGETEFTGVCEMLETRGIIATKRAKESRLTKLTLKLEESELEHALQDKLLITSVLEHGIPS